MATDPATDPWGARLPDGGPWYVETETAGPSALVVEPWNAASAAVFIVLAAAWLVRLRGRYDQYPALSAALVILLMGGVGGTLFHALRSSSLFLALDVGPIGVLALGASLLLWLRARLSGWGWAGLLGLLVLGQILVRDWPHQAVIFSQYLSLAAGLLVPLAVALYRDQFRHGAWVVLALACFAVAVVCRWLDVRRPPVLPMGTHWLWHLFGAATTAALLEYFYRSQPRRRTVTGG